MTGCGRWVRATVLLSLAALVVAVVGARAWAWPWDKQKNACVDLVEIMRNPQAFAGREIMFKCRFALHGKLFKDLNTQFNAGEHANFAVWAMKAQLWEKTERRNVLPTLYIDKSITPNYRTLNGLARYDVVEVTGRVVSTYAGLPWILVSSLIKVDDPAQKLSDTTIVHIRRGIDLIDEEKGAIAVRHLETAMEEGVPEEHKPLVLSKLGKAYKQAGDLAKAEDAMKQAVELKVDDAEAYFVLAEIQLARGDAEGAIENCQKTMSLSPNFPQAHAIMGEAFGKKGETQKALEQCDLAANMTGLSVREKSMVEVRRARILAQAEQYADAIRAYARAIEGPLGAESDIRKEIGQLYESRYDATGNVKTLEEAGREYANANVLANNRDADGLYLSARVAFKQAKAENAGAYGKAKELLASCLAIDAHCVPALGLQAQICVEEGDLEKAEEILKGLMQNGGKNVDTMLILAGAYEKMNKEAEAKNVYAHVIEAAPENIAALEKHAALCEKLGDPEGAKMSLAALVDLRPNDLGYALRLGTMHFNGGDYATASQVLAKAALAPGAQGEAAGILLGRASALRGDIVGAEMALRGVLKNNAGNAEAMGRLAMLLADQGRKSEEALDLAQKAYAQNQGNAMYADILGWAQVQAGKSADAVQTLESIAAEGRGRMAWYHLAMAKFNVQDYAGAREAAGKAMAPQQAGELEAVVNVIQGKVKGLLEAIDKAETKVKQEALRRESQREHVAEAPAGEGHAGVEQEAEAIRSQVEAVEAKETEVAPADGKPVEVPPVVTRYQAQAPVSTEAASWAEGEADPKAASQPAAKPNRKAADPIEIPGVVEPDLGSDYSTLTGPAGGETNTVKNLPVRTESIESAEAQTSGVSLPPKPVPTVPAPGAEEEEKPVAIPEVTEPPMPSIAVEWEKAPAETAGEETAKPADASKNLPRNDINALPDWAK